MRTLNEIGCRIWDAYARALPGPELHEVKDLLYRNRLIVLKDQARTQQGYCEIAGRFGLPGPYLQEHYRHPDIPLIFVSCNVKKEGRQTGVPPAGSCRHSDTSFEQEPKVVTMLMPTVRPQYFPCNTRCIDMAGVYAALPRSARDRLADADRMPGGRWRDNVRPEDIGMEIFEILRSIDMNPPVSSTKHQRAKLLH